MLKAKLSVSEKIGMAVIGIVLATMVFLCIFPFYHMLVVAISNGTAVIQGKVTIWPIGFSLESFKQLFRDPYVGYAYKNTLLYVFLGTIINLFLTTMCAYPLSRHNLIGKKYFMGIIVFTMLFSGGMIPTYIMVAITLNLKNTFWAVLLLNGMSTFNMIVMRTFFITTIPESLVEAAKIDGANDIKIFTRVVLPLAKPILATMFLFYAVAQWNRFFDYMLFLNDKKTYPLQLLIRAMVIEGNLGETAQKQSAANDLFVSETGIKYAVILITVLPIIMLYPFIQKYLVKGQMVGSLKG